MTAPPKPALADDLRWIEHRDAGTAALDGIRATPEAHERYRNSLFPYCELLAEHCNGQPIMRHEMMQCLINAGMPLGLILTAFRAEEDEASRLQERPPLKIEPVDEISRLQALPYRVYLTTPHWQGVRQEAFRFWSNRCAFCNRTELLQVHHRTYGYGPNRRLGCERLTDVIVMCDPCHRRHHEQPRPAA